MNYDDKYDADVIRALQIFPDRVRVDVPEAEFKREMTRLRTAARHFDANLRDVEKYTTVTGEVVITFRARPVQHQEKR